MSGIELMVDDIDGRLHAALMRGMKMIDLYTDAKDQTASWASLYLGRVDKIDKNLDAAIISLGNGQMGFLPAKHVHLPGADASEKRTGIADLLQAGQMILVQIKSESRSGSRHEQHKMPRLTTKLYVQGQFLVYCPLASQVTMSRRIENEATIALSSKLKGRGGWIILPAAQKATEEAFFAEAAQLQKEWQSISEERASDPSTPRLLRAGPDALFRALFDYGDAAFDHIHAGSRAIFDKMAIWCKRYNPALATSKRLRLFKPEKPGQKLFDIYDTFAEVEALDDSIVHMEGGGNIIIDQTHALVVIDVNQGSSVSRQEANLEAARETARQIRLRNLSGAILVDFIGMELRLDRTRVLEMIEMELANDYALAHVHGLTRLGIVEITRKRRTAMYSEKIRT